MASAKGCANLPKMIFLLGFFVVNISQSSAGFSPNVLRFTSTETSSQTRLKFAYINMKALEGYILDLPPIKTITTENMTFCQQECLISTNCLSNNVVELSGGGYICSILSDDIYKKPWKKIFKEGGTHFVIMNQCVFETACQSPDVCIPEYQNNTYSCHGPGTEKNPATSCRELYAADNTLPTGLYWIRFPQDVVVQALCDMTMHDGKAGWLMIVNATVNDLSILDKKLIMSLPTLKYVNDGNHLSRFRGTLLSSIYPIKKIRIKCYKESVGKVLHIVNSDTENGKHLLNWALGVDKTRQIVNDAAACADAIVRLPDDNNPLSMNCDNVGGANQPPNPWNLYLFPLKYNSSTIVLALGDPPVMLCGDISKSQFLGYWYYYVW